MAFCFLLCNFAGEMRLHVFNPEHDIALACNLSNFTAPHAGRQLRADLSYLPALWADDGDAVLVDNVEDASQKWVRQALRLASLLDLQGIGQRHIRFLQRCHSVSAASVDNLTSVDPWGWDMPLRAQLKRMGIADGMLLSEAQIAAVRQLSHRRTASRLLTLLQNPGTVGESYECTSEEQVGELLGQYGRLVIKAPWSSSGRGVRFVDVERYKKAEAQNERRWICKVIAKQGSVMAEPCYNKVKDFGMEFTADGKGGIRYEGLSLFHTENGAYTGSILATEKAKRNALSNFVSVDLLDSVRQKIIESADLADYCGPFGVDMMLVTGGMAGRLSDSITSAESRPLLLHPCVEINLRRTMGHMALRLSPKDDDLRHVMRIIYDGHHYKLKINKLL